MTRRLVIASGNAHKVDEIAQMLAASEVPAARDLEVVSMKALGQPPEIDETGSTFAANAALKSRGIGRWLRTVVGVPGDDLVLADDSGICIDAFDGRPGVHSARFAGPDASDDANNARMVRELEARGLDRSAAHYACILSLARVDDEPLPVPAGDPALYASHGTVCIEGRCHGDVRTVAHGSGGFGYDPYFWVDGDARTFADLTAEQKAARSHRGAAVAAMLRHGAILFA